MVILKNLSFYRNQGAVLPIGLIFLMLLTLLGISNVRVTSLEEKMSGNSKDQNLAFQYAEMALRAGEARIESIRANGAGLAPFGNGSPGLFNISSDGTCLKRNPPDPNLASTWTDDNASVQLDTGSSLVATQPRYFITYSTHHPSGGSEPDTYGFTITARGTGLQNTTQVVLQSHYSGQVAW
jgi:type IV pilus assembly protein PilX